MKRFIQVTSFLLIFTGYALTPYLLAGEEIIAWVHLILGFLYAVAFLLFAMDHIQQHQDMLKTRNPRNLTGLLQISSGAVVLVTGFVIYLFGSERIDPWSDIHLWATVVFMFSLLVHFKSKNKE